MATQLLEDIYTHPEYLQALREEVKGVLNDPSANMTNLPLLESFLVESIRTHCFLATVIHRVPLRSYTFSDGYTVPPGEIVEFYQHKVMSDNSTYPDAMKFNPERFKGTGKTSCDMGMSWPFWGNSKMAWYVARSPAGLDGRWTN
jgi:cytochrome P450